MKISKLIALAVMLSASTASFAQFANAGSKSNSGSSASVDEWSSFSVSYNPVSLSPEHGDNISATGFSATYSKAWSISQSSPIFIEGGVGLQYAFDTEDLGDMVNDSDGKVTLQQKYNLLTLKVPVNIMYAFSVPNSNVKIAPFAGLTANINILGTTKYDFEMTGIYGSYESELMSYIESTYGKKATESRNLFDKDDMGSKEATWNRFVLGAQIGANVYFDKWYFGASYGFGLTEIAEKCKMNVSSITVGLKF